jgi:ADP-ribose pyrophosphatase YjhB (NUDIX family)
MTDYTKCPPNPYPQVSTAVLLFGADMLDACPRKILLTKRISKHQDGKYGCPGGKTDFGETLKESAERELFEETGIRAECLPTGYLANCCYHEENKHFLCVWFTALIDRREIDFVEKDAEGKPKCEGWKWYSYESALYLPMMPSTLDAWLHLDSANLERIKIKEYSDKAAINKQKKAINIMVEFDDGERMASSGADAAEIWEHIGGVETFAYAHGIHYKGPSMKVVKKGSP